jgi:hypothetical protein
MGTSGGVVGVSLTTIVGISVPVPVAIAVAIVVAGGNE